MACDVTSSLISRACSRTQRQAGVAVRERASTLLRSTRLIRCFTPSGSARLTTMPA